MIILALGLPGTGKTQALIDYAAENSESQRFFVVDRAGDWQPTDEEGNPNPRWRGREKELGIYEVGDIEDMDFEPPGIYVFGYPYEAIEVASVARAVGNATYVDDEIDLVATYSKWLDNPLRDFVHRGRHLPNAEGQIGTMHILGAARRPENLHTDLTGMADQVFIFRIQSLHTLKRLTAESMIRQEDWPTVRTMQNFHYLLWRNDGTTTPGLIDPPKWPDNVD